MTDKRCPKCGSRSFTIIEYSTADYYYEVEDGVVTPDGMGDDCEHVRTDCHCSKCGYWWHPRRFDYTIDK